MKRFFKCEEGSHIGLFAILLPVLLFFVMGVTDLSAIYTTSVRLQKAVDAAAISYMRQFPVLKTKALGSFPQDVKDLAELNANTHGGSNSASADITIKESGKFRTGYTVTITEKADYVFASAFGIASGKTITKKATISAFAADAAPDVLPLGIDYAAYMSVLNSGNLNGVTIKYGSHSDGSWRGACIPLTYGHGASDWEALLSDGIDRVDIGDTLYLKPGNMSGPTKAINARISSCPHSPKCTASHYHQDCPRVCILPVLADLNDSLFLDEDAGVSGKYGKVVALLPVIVSTPVTGSGVDSIILCDIIGDMVLSYDYIGGSISDDTSLFAAKLTE